jgi:NMD protein affecting ribosome stability and mRNA decay
MITCSQCGKPKPEQPTYLCDDCIKPFPVASSDLVERLRKTEYRNGFAIISIQEVYEAADTIQRLEVLLNLVSQRET